MQVRKFQAQQDLLLVALRAIGGALYCMGAANAIHFCSTIWLATSCKEPRHFSERSLLRMAWQRVGCVPGAKLSMLVRQARGSSIATLRKRPRLREQQWEVCSSRELCIYLSIYLSFHPSDTTSIYMSVSTYLYTLLYLSIHLIQLFCLYLYLHLYLNLNLCICMCIYICIYLAVFPSI